MSYLNEDVSPVNTFPGSFDPASATAGNAGDRQTIQLQKTGGVNVTYIVPGSIVVGSANDKTKEGESALLDGVTNVTDGTAVIDYVAGTITYTATNTSAVDVGSISFRYFDSALADGPTPTGLGRNPGLGKPFTLGVEAVNVMLRNQGQITTDNKSGAAGVIVEYSDDLEKGWRTVINGLFVGDWHVPNAGRGASTFIRVTTDNRLRVLADPLGAI